MLYFFRLRTIREDRFIVQLILELDSDVLHGSRFGYHRKCYANYTHPKTLANIKGRSHRGENEVTEDVLEVIPSTSSAELQDLGERRLSVRRKGGDAGKLKDGI